MSVEALDLNSDFAIEQPGWCETALGDLRSKAVSALFVTASYLTDPVCKGHEFSRRISIVDVLNPADHFLCNLARKIALFMGMIGWYSLAIVTTLPGIALREVGARLQKNPFTYFHAEGPDKVLPEDRTFSLLSSNICGTTSGHVITDGGVLPLTYRINEIINKIVEKDADVNSLNEVYDIQTANYLIERLKQTGYHHFYFNMGPGGIRVPSGIFIASKYKINHPEFTQYPQDSLVGRTKHNSKGVFAFDLESGGKNFARIYSTHLQHSEVSQFPTEEEVESRKKQMQIIIDKMDKVRDRCLVLTGDLNLGDDEYNASSWRSRFQKADQFGPNDKTWGGDEFCAKLMGIRPSCPLNLDHAMVASGTGRLISTTLLKTGFDGKVMKKEALSDHAGLYSRIVA